MEVKPDPEGDLEGNFKSSVDGALMENYFAIWMNSYFDFFSCTW